MIKNNKVFIQQIKINNYCCQHCNYPVLSSKNNCAHQFCDYCWTTLYSSKLAECKICKKLFKQQQHNGSYQQT